MRWLIILALLGCAYEPTHGSHWAGPPFHPANLEPPGPLTWAEDMGQERTGQVPLPQRKPT